MNEIKIGTKLWRRSYSQRPRDQRWEEVAVIGENRINWLVSRFTPSRPLTNWDLDQASRLPKKKPLPKDYVATKAEADEIDRVDRWVGKNSYPIQQMVGHIRDYGLLVKVAELIGYTPSED
jgi:hypothetical protein